MSNVNNRDSLIQEINQVLYNYGFKTSKIYDRSCFNLLARKKLLLLILKVLVNIDSINEFQAKEIKRLSYIFMGSPLLVGVKSKYNYLEEDVVYERQGIPVIGLETFKNIITEKEYPEILADRGGYYVNINGNMLKEAREEYGFSLKDLADLVRVSRETIYKYENSLSRSSPETVMILEDLLNLKITLSIDVFKVPKDIGNHENEKLKIDVIHAENLEKLGFGIIPTQKTPFDALTKINNDDTIITNLELKRKENTLKKMAISLKDLSIITLSESVFILDNDNIKNSIDGIPVVKSWEMKEMETPKEFLKIVDERKIS